MTENLSNLSDDRIAYLEGLVRQGRIAAAIFTQFTQQDVDRIVKAMVLAGLEQGSIPRSSGNRRDRARAAGG